MNLFEIFIEKDFNLKETLKLAEESAKFFVSPRFYESLMELCAPEIAAIAKLHKRLQESRKSVKTLIHEKLEERGKYLNSLEH